MRRWNYFNQNAFLHITTIRTTTLPEQLEEENQSGLPPSSCCSSSIMIISTGPDNTSRCNWWIPTSTLLPLVSQVNGFLNFNDGMVHYVATSIMTENDRQKASRITVYKHQEMDNKMRECRK